MPDNRIPNRARKQCKHLATPQKSCPLFFLTGCMQDFQLNKKFGGELIVHISTLTPIFYNVGLPAPNSFYKSVLESRSTNHEQQRTFSMTSPRALYLNFKNDFGDLLEVTDFSIPLWLAFGASLQLISLSWLPLSLNYWLPLL